MQPSLPFFKMTQFKAECHGLKTRRLLSSDWQVVTAVPDVDGAGRRGLRRPGGLAEELPHLWTLRVMKLSRLHWITFYWIILTGTKNINHLHLSCCAWRNLETVKQFDNTEHH